MKALLEALLTAAGHGDDPVTRMQVSGDVPQPRVGAASTVLKGKIYVFSGRGGIDMAPIEEEGSLWVFDRSSASWSSMKPADSAAAKPEGRSYHAMTNNGTDTVYVHAGCPTNGRLDDLWAFNVNDRTWKQFASAPPPARGGPSIAYSQGCIHRMNGFDGKTEQGGALDSYDIAKDAWTTISYLPDGKEGPIARSVCTLLAVDMQGSPALVTFFGESDPSNLGHAGAGKMLSDVWSFDLSTKRWQLVEIVGERPPARGWFDADTIHGQPALVVSGGLAESNERLDDVWMLKFE